MDTSQTRIDAWHSVQPDLSELQQRVYDIIVRGGPITDEQISIETGLNPSTARPRRVELQDKLGLIVPGPLLKNKSGRRAVGWITKERQKMVRMHGGTV